ncbi:MAG: hypothetical protein NT065_00870 [Chlamydiae bacterium]|nr:hypothetical protein [Chlamydiota bacterium]
MTAVPTNCAALDAQITADEGAYIDAQEAITNTQGQISDLSDDITNISASENGTFDQDAMHQIAIDALEIIALVAQECTEQASLYGAAMQVTADTTTCVSSSQTCLNDATNTMLTTDTTNLITPASVDPTTGVETDIVINPSLYTDNTDVTQDMTDFNYFNKMAIDSQQFLVDNNAVDASSLSSLEQSIQSEQSALGYDGTIGDMSYTDCQDAGSAYAASVIYANYDPSSAPIGCDASPSGQMSGTIGANILNEVTQGNAGAQSTVAGISSMTQTMVEYWANMQSSAIGALSYASDQTAQGITVSVNNQISK